MTTLFRYQDPSGAVLLISQHEGGAVHVEIFANVAHALIELPPADAQYMAGRLAKRYPDSEVADRLTNGAYQR